MCQGLMNVPRDVKGDVSILCVLHTLAKAGRLLCAQAFSSNTVQLWAVSKQA